MGQGNHYENGIGYGLPVSFVFVHPDKSATFRLGFAFLSLVSAVLLLRIVYVISELRIWDAMWRAISAIEFLRPVLVDEGTEIPERFPLQFHLSSHFVAMLVVSFVLFLNVAPPRDWFCWTNDDYWGFPFRIFYRYQNAEGIFRVNYYDDTSLIAQILVDLTLVLSALVGCEIAGGMRKEGYRFAKRLWSFLRPSVKTIILGRWLSFALFSFFFFNAKGDENWVELGWPKCVFIFYCSAWHVWGYRYLAFDMYVWLAIVLVPCIVCEFVVRQRRRAQFT